MELAATISNPLKIIGNSDFSNKSFEQIVRKVFDSFGFDENQSLKINFDKNGLKNLENNLAEIKEIISSLYTLITEFAKYDYDSNLVSGYLEEIGFNEEKIKLFIELYNEKKSLIRMFLMSISKSNTHVVDVNWKLDYCVKEDTIERINEPNYIIDLILEKPNNDILTNLQFSCTIEKLQDLVYKLKEASKSLEKLGQLKDVVD